MGTFNVTMEIGDTQGLRFEQVKAHVDTGASITTMPSSLLRRLGVSPTRVGRFKTADGNVFERGIGDTHMRIQDLEIVASVTFGDEGIFLLGAQTLEGLMLGVDPTNKRLVPVEGLVMQHISTTGVRCEKV